MQNCENTRISLSLSILPVSSSVSSNESRGIPAIHSAKLILKEILPYTHQY